MRKLVKYHRTALRRKGSNSSNRGRRAAASTNAKGRPTSSSSSQHACPHQRRTGERLDRYPSLKSSGAAKTVETPVPSICEPAILSALLKLPTEVRICILRYLVPTTDRGMVFYTDSGLYDGKNASRRKPPTRAGDQTELNSLAIMRANRLIYHEAASILYSDNAFHFIGSNYLPILAFIRRLSPDAKRLVRKIRVTWLESMRSPRDAQFNLFCMAILDALPGLISFDSGSWVWF